MVLAQCCDCLFESFSGAITLIVIFVQSVQQHITYLLETEPWNLPEVSRAWMTLTRAPLIHFCTNINLSTFSTADTQAKTLVAVVAVICTISTHRIRTVRPVNTSCLREISSTEPSDSTG